METKEQILKDFKRRMINVYLAIGVAAITTFGGLFYGNHIDKISNDELNAKKRNVLVRQYLDTKDFVLPYLRAELKIYDNKLDSSLVSEDLRQKLGEIDERKLDRKRNLEEALQIAKNDSSKLSQTIEVKDYNSQLESSSESSDYLFLGEMLSLLSFGGLALHLSNRAIGKKTKALGQLRQIGAQ